MTDRKNTQNDANAIIAAVMSNEQQNNNRQAALVNFMFSNEVTYSPEEIEKLFKVTGKERTELLSKAVSNVSDEYSDTIQMLNDLRDKKREDKASFTNAEAMQLEQTNNKVKAANALFERALRATYHLRAIDAFGLKVLRNGALTFYHYQLDENGAQITDPKGNPVSSPVTMSGNQLVTKGKKDINEKLGKASAPATSNNPSKGGIATAASAVSQRLNVRRNNGVVGFEGMSDDEEKAAETLLKDMFAARFMDDTGNIDMAAVKEYVEETFAKADTEKAA